MLKLLDEAVPIPIQDSHLYPRDGDCTTTLRSGVGHRNELVGCEHLPWFSSKGIANTGCEVLPPHENVVRAIEG